MKRFFRRFDTKVARQQSFEFVNRSRRHVRWFKLAILIAAGAAIGAALNLMTRSGLTAMWAPSRATQAVRSALGMPTPRAQIDERWRRFRTQGIAESQRVLPGIYENAGPDVQRLMRYAGLDPDHALLRWGNYDRTLLLPSTIFEADKNGRSYRLRRCVDSIWLREISIRGMLGFFLVPDGPGLAAAIRSTTALPVEESKQSTNSWGLRGPEPDLQAPLRGLVLGDSFMQGLFIGDADTPPECLRRDLESRLKTKISMLNTGHLGYSPEQYYYSLVEYADRFRPHFVVMSVFAYDFAGEFSEAAMKGLGGDWEDAKYWLEKIIALCRSHGWTYLVVPAPYEPTLLGKRQTGHYPGALSNDLGESSLTFLDPSENMLNAHLDLVVAGRRDVKRPAGSPLFNGQYGDGHFSALGAKAWGEATGHRLALLLEQNPAVTLGAH